MIPIDPLVINLWPVILSFLLYGSTFHQLTSTFSIDGGNPLASSFRTFLHLLLSILIPLNCFSGRFFQSYLFLEDLLSPLLSVSISALIISGPFLLTLPFGAVLFSTRNLQCHNFLTSSLYGISFHGINHMVVDYR